MKQTIVVAAATILLSLNAQIVIAQTSVPAKVAETSKGKTLVDPNGLTLYTFDNDKTAGQSACNGKCATNWPPFQAPTNAANMGNWSVIVRGNNSKQWAYKGKPLYRWMEDKKPGDVDGDGRFNVWHVAVP
jgi:predicted lipoprotein with Yx(FWY)xxD motif